MHVRTLLPQLLDSLGYSFRPSERSGLDCIAERDGHVYGVVVRHGEVTAAQAVELRLLALSHDLIPLLVAPDGLAPDGARWAEGFGIPIVGPSTVHTFEARIAAEEEALAQERTWALEHAADPGLLALSWMDPGPPSDWILPAVATDLPLEVPVSLLPPEPPASSDPYAVDGLLVLRRSELLDRTRSRIEAAAAALSALPFPAPQFAAPLAPEPYGIDGLWVAGVAERLLAQATADASVGAVLADMPWPVLEERATVPAALPEPAALLPEPVAAPAPAALPWEAPAAPPEPEPAPEPLAVPALPWVDVDTRLPWDVTHPQEAEDPKVELLRQQREAALAARRLGGMIPPVSQDHLVARADPSVWGTRGRLDEIRARLNARNVALSVEGVQSDWLKGIVEDPVGEGER